MNTKLTVRKIADSNYIPIKYGVVEMTVGVDSANTNVVIQTIRVGWDTEAHFLGWKSTWDGATATLQGRNVAGMQGIIGALEVVALNTLIAYEVATPSTDQ